MSEGSPREIKMRDQWRAWRVSSLGLEIGLSVALGAWLGHLLEQKFEFEPWGLLAGTLLGVAAGGRALYKAAKRVLNEPDPKAPQNPEAKP